MKTKRTDVIVIEYSIEENQEASKKTVRLIKEGFKVTETVPPTQHLKGVVKLEKKG